MEREGIEPTGQAEGAATRAALGAAVAMCPKTPLRGLLQPTDFTMVDIGETVGPITSVFGLPATLTTLAVKSVSYAGLQRGVFGQAEQASLDLDASSRGTPPDCAPNVAKWATDGPQAGSLRWLQVAYPNPG